MNDRYTDLSFALGNRLLGVLDEKQHRERENEDNHVGWYHKTDFQISAVIGGEDFHYEGRFDIGDGEGNLISHIKNFYEYSLSPNCPFIPEWKKQGEDYYREKIESLKRGRDVFIPYLEQHTELTKEDETLLAEIMATADEWFKVPEEKEPYEDKPRFTVEQTSDAFDEPFIIRDNNFVSDTQGGRYYAIDGIYQTFNSEKEAQEVADRLNEDTPIIRNEQAANSVIGGIVPMDDGDYRVIEVVGTGIDDEVHLESITDPTKHTVDTFGYADYMVSGYDVNGKEITIDNRRYLIESVNKISGDVSMRDITFQNNAGFPINRVEKIGYVRRLLEQAEKQPETDMLATTETVAEYPAVENGLPYDITIQKIQFDEPEKKRIDEAPAVIAERNNYRITKDTLGIGGAKEKFRANMAAVNLLHDLEIENRLATPEEQEILAGYVGWGGLSMAFDENNAAWANEFRELYATLSPEEYRAAMESTLTAFYTPPVVIKAMYEALDRLGFTQGNLLEPSCGTGNFFGLLPDSMAGSKLYGVEIDPLTGEIAKQLYQKPISLWRALRTRSCQIITLMWYLAMYRLASLRWRIAATTPRNSLSMITFSQRLWIRYARAAL